MIKCGGLWVVIALWWIYRGVSDQGPASLIIGCLFLVFGPGYTWIAYKQAAKVTKSVDQQSKSDD